mmetsp:Transcript_96692/g.242563  ORF Transcript_96692/g.242563 Transcript_96692/m.242563 type:complete len:214 (-) Transcript_96692:84-725(-)
MEAITSSKGMSQVLAMNTCGGGGSWVTYSTNEQPADLVIGSRTRLHNVSKVNVGQSLHKCIFTSRANLRILPRLTPAGVVQVVYFRPSCSFWHPSLSWTIPRKILLTSSKRSGYVSKICASYAYSGMVVPGRLFASSPLHFVLSSNSLYPFFTRAFPPSCKMPLNSGKPAIWFKICRLSVSCVQSVLQMSHSSTRSMSGPDEAHVEPTRPEGV